MKSFYQMESSIYREYGKSLACVRLLYFLIFFVTQHLIWTYINIWDHSDSTYKVIEYYEMSTFLNNFY